MKVKHWVGAKSAGIHHYCPACQEQHTIWLTGPTVWEYDNNAELPSFHPSVKVTSYEGKVVSAVCHYFIKGGKIQYCADSTHSYAGKTVDLPDIPPSMI